MNITGNYTLTSSSSIDIYSYIYQENIYPSYPSYNIVAQDDDTGTSGQFKLTAFLRSHRIYILLFTRFVQCVLELFSILASDPNDVIFNSINYNIE